MVYVICYFMIGIAVYSGLFIYLYDESDSLGTRSDVKTTVVFSGLFWPVAGMLATICGLYIALDRVLLKIQHRFGVKHD